MATVTPDPWDQIVGQPEAISLLRANADSPVHAYMFVGPEGSGKRQTARLFGAAILTDSFTSTDTDRILKLAQREQLADLTIIEPEGRSFLVADAKRAIEASSQPPTEKQHRIVLLDRFHTASPEVAPSLLKTIEEPPSRTIIIVSCEFVASSHDTIASRCVQINFNPLTPKDIRDWLLNDTAYLMDSPLATQIAEASQGSQTRAALLAEDSSFRDRLKLWQDAPRRCGTSGADATYLTDEVVAYLDEAQTPLAEKHEAELAELEAEAEKYQMKTVDKKTITARHKRELRQFRESELRWGLSLLAKTYWAETQKNNFAGSVSAGVCEEALALLKDTQKEMVRNPNEALMLQNLFRQLPYADCGGYSDPF